MKKATKIKITRAEGPHHLCVPREFEGDDCWKEATHWLWSQSYSFPKNGGYDKHDLLVTFEDGETYEGRLDCTHHARSDADLNVAKHVRSFLTFLSGARRPAHMSTEQYARYLGEVGQPQVDNAKAFLADYESRFTEARFHARARLRSGASAGARLERPATPAAGSPCERNT